MYQWSRNLIVGSAYGLASQGTDGTEFRGSRSARRTEGTEFRDSYQSALHEAVSVALSSLRSNGWRPDVPEPRLFEVGRTSFVELSTDPPRSRGHHLWIVPLLGLSAGSVTLAAALRRRRNGAGTRPGPAPPNGLDARSALLLTGGFGLCVMYLLDQALRTLPRPSRVSRDSRVTQSPAGPCDIRLRDVVAPERCGVRHAAPAERRGGGRGTAIDRRTCPLRGGYPALRAPALVCCETLPSHRHTEGVAADRAVLGRRTYGSGSCWAVRAAPFYGPSQRRVIRRVRVSRARLLALRRGSHAA